MARDPEQIRQEIETTRENMGETVDALAYKTDVKSRTSDWVHGKKDAVTGVADTVANRVRGTAPDVGTEDVKQGAKRGVRVAKENPLGLAVGGVAVGFLAGLAFPSTRVEDEKIGQVADELKDRTMETGREAVERGKHVAQEAGQAAMETAKETGQEQSEEMSSSLRENAQEVKSRVN